MKKINIIFVLIFLLTIGAIGSYIYFIDSLSQTKQIKQEIVSLQHIKQNIQKPIIQKVTSTQMAAKKAEYEAILERVELIASVESNNGVLVIDGAITDTYSYMMLKRVLNIIKNDTLKVQKLCMGAGCNEYEYGFFVELEPFVLSYR